MRRFLGPISGPIAFFLVAALVFGGLGWVTYSALHVEQAQREAAARAELGNNLRVALWRLDGRMLPALSVEDSRPYHHYAPPDPATPLLVAELPGWMKLHFQLDPNEGWYSPQVLPPEAADQVRQIWPGVPLRNLTPDRATVLDDLKTRYPARDTIDAFTASDRANPDDSWSLSVPLLSGVLPPTPQTDDKTIPTPQPPAANPTTNAIPPMGNSVSNGAANGVKFDQNFDSFRILGWELCPCGESVTNTYRQDAQASQKGANESLGQPAPDPRQMQQNTPGVASRGGARMPQKDADNNDRAWSDLFNRYQTIIRGRREAANQATEPLLGRGQLGNGLNSTYGQNFGSPQLDQMKNSGNTLTPGAPGGGPGGKIETPLYSNPPLPGAPGSGGPAGPGAAPGSVPAPLAPTTGVKGAEGDKGKKGKDTKEGKGTYELAKSGDRDGDSKNLSVLAADMFKYRTYEQEKQSAERDKLTKRINDDVALLTFETFGWFSHPGDRGLRRAIDEAAKARLRDSAEPMNPGDKPKEGGAAAVPAAPTMGPPVPPTVPADERPTGGIGAGGGVPAAVPLPGLGLPVAIHLGSMRPQWVTALDGSEMLVLVRPAKIDNKTVYQGVVLDWAKLEAALKNEVKDLFPDAKLVPVKDPADVQPDRTMTALPVQLDPGPEPPLTPAGWTPLRIGLVLAWIAAIIAFAAVGFAGWSLIDLAERRIRFVSAVTHELRTPLTSLRLYLDLLVSGMIQDETKRQEYLNTLTMESDRLHRLIDNVLDFARLEKRKKNGDIKPVKVNELLEQLRQTWTDRVAHDGKELVVISTLPAEREVSTDAAMIQQIVANLIDNARKYTREAADKRIWVWAKPGKGNAVVLEVEDRGPGVPGGERKSIFKPFRRGDQADSKAGGAGLGLALAKSWADVLGARLTYRPAEGGTGACFRLELPGK